jgi:hypothetical protein
MRLLKTLMIPGLLACVVISGVAETTLAKKEVKYTNLKVLSKNISSKDLQGIMADDFEDGLGVTCGFCHANAKDGHGLDFASDAKPEKEITRAMMRMTLGINRKYFKIRHPAIGSNALTVTCTTCHKGEAFPDGEGH